MKSKALEQLTQDAQTADRQATKTDGGKRWAGSHSARTKQ
jgi:hypothetical protein